MPFQLTPAERTDPPAAAPAGPDCASGSRWRRRLCHRTVWRLAGGTELSIDGAPAWLVALVSRAVSTYTRRRETVLLAGELRTPAGSAVELSALGSLVRSLDRRPVTWPVRPAGPGPDSDRRHDADRPADLVITALDTADVPIRRVTRLCRSVAASGVLAVIAPAPAPEEARRLRAGFARHGLVWLDRILLPRCQPSGSADPPSRRSELLVFVPAIGMDQAVIR